MNIIFYLFYQFNIFFQKQISPRTKTLRIFSGTYEFYIFKSQITIILIVTSQTYKFQQKLELRYFLKYLSENDFLGFFLQSLSLESDMF